MHLTDSLTRSILLLLMIGGKDQYIVFFQFLHILVHGLGNSGVAEVKSIAYRNLLSLNMIIPVFAPVDREHCTKG